jgi:transcription elongation factor Elf1
MAINSFEPVYLNQNNKQDDPAVCTACKCTWFEQIEVRQLKSNHSSVLGQNVPPANDYKFIIMRCIKCGQKHQPNILAGRQDQEVKHYNDLLDFLDTPEQITATTAELREKIEKLEKFITQKPVAEPIE